MPLEALRLAVTPIGLHYLLTHYDIPIVGAHEWQLEIGGRVETPRTLSLDEILAQPAMELTVTLECAGNGRAHMTPRPFSQPWLEEAVGTACWTGTPLAPLLHDAGIKDGAVEVVFTGLDRGNERGVELAFERSLPLDEAIADDVLLAWAINDQPLPPQHGYPLRLLVPGWYGMASVKWLSRITVVDRPFSGHQQSYAYRLRQTEDEEGEPLTRTLPRALLIPPGIPDFPTRRRTLGAGPCTLEGRAWSGFAPIERVDVSTDDGAVVGAGRARAGRRLAIRLVSLAAPLRGEAWRNRARLPGGRRKRTHPAAGARMEPERLREQRRPAGACHDRLSG